MKQGGYAVHNAEHKPDVKYMAAPNGTVKGGVAISVCDPVRWMDRVIGEDGLMEQVKAMATAGSRQMG